MINIIIGNIIALTASIIMVYSGTLNNKKKILYYQTVQIFLSVISNLILGGISGAIINTISLIRNIICYKEKLDFAARILITALVTFLTLKFNNLGLLGLLPLLSTITYIWLMNIKDVKKFKLLIAYTMFLWFIYDLLIKSYTSAVFDLINMFANIFTCIKLSKQNISTNK